MMQPVPLSGAEIVVLRKRRFGRKRYHSRASGVLLSDRLRFWLAYDTHGIVEQPPLYRIWFRCYLATYALD